MSSIIKSKNLCKTIFMLWIISFLVQIIGVSLSSNEHTFDAGDTMHILGWIAGLCLFIALICYNCWTYVKIIVVCWLILIVIAIILYYVGLLYVRKLGKITINQTTSPAA